MGKITLAMLKKEKNFDDEEDRKKIIGIVKEVLENIEKNEKKFDADYIKPLDLDDDKSCDLLIVIGGLVMCVAKSMFTPAAWKYFVERLIKKMEETE